VLAYGQTSTGKTFTTLGSIGADLSSAASSIADASFSERRQLGLIQLAVQQIFATLMSSPNSEFMVSTKFREKTHVRPCFRAHCKHNSYIALAYCSCDSASLRYIMRASTTFWIRQTQSCKFMVSAEINSSCCTDNPQQHCIC
jgi:hypothetical protein